MKNEIEKLHKQLEEEKALKEMYFTYYKAKHSDIKGEFFKLKAECEGWRNRCDEWMSKCEQETKLREFIGEQLDQLKAENEKYQQTLVDIKDIAERETDSKEFMAIQCMLNGSVDDKNKVLKQILQLIKECEVEDDRQD